MFQSDAARHSSFREGLKPVFSQPDRPGLQTRNALPQMAESSRSGRALRGHQKGPVPERAKLFSSRVFVNDISMIRGAGAPAPPSRRGL
jgi:hypothetical protein